MCVNGKVIDGKERHGRKIFFIFFVLTFFSFPQAPLHYAASNGSVECLNTLIKHGADMAAKTVRNERECESASQKKRCVGICVTY